MYEPGTVPDKPGMLSAFLREELTRIAEQQTTTNAQILNLQPLHVEPVRPRQGWVVYADGSDWDPGSGEGVYRYDGSSWNPLG